MRVHRLCAIAGAIASLTAATALEARTATATVQFDDLDLSNPADVARLESRIDRAVRTLCGARIAFSVTTNAAQSRQQCRASARHSANQELARVLGREQRNVAAVTFGTGSDD